MGFKCLHRGRLHTLLGQLFQCCAALNVGKFFLLSVLLSFFQSVGEAAATELGLRGEGLVELYSGSGTWGYLSHSPELHPELEALGSQSGMEGTLPGAARGI